MKKQLKKRGMNSKSGNSLFQLLERQVLLVSGGQLQRMMTAMAMSPRPDLIIFDEPTTALDVTTQVEVLAAMKDIVKEFNTAAIYITHDLAVVAQMADFIKVLRYGEEVEQANTRVMLDAPEKEYTKSLWSVRPWKNHHRHPLIPFLKLTKYMQAMARALKYSMTLVSKFHVGKP